MTRRPLTAGRGLAPILATLLLAGGCSSGDTEVKGVTAPSPSEETAAAIPPGSFEAGTDADGLDAIVDAAGVLHLVWWEGTSITGARLHARSVTPGGVGEPEPIAAGFEIVEADPELLLGPEDEPCIALEGWPDAEDISTEGLYLSCRSSGSWEEPTLVEQRGVTADYATALDGDGSPVTIHISPPSSIAFGELELGDGSTVQNPAFAIDDAGTYHVTWQSLGDPGGLMYRTSSDAGATWSEPETLNDGEFFTRPSELAVTPDGTVHVFFASSDLFHRSGATSAFGALETVVTEIGNVPSTGSIDPDGTAHAFWTDAGGVQHATGANASWSAPTLVPSTEGAVADDLATAVGSDGAVYVAWIEAGDPPVVRYAAA